MLVYLLCIIMISSDLLIAMNAKQWRCAQITKCLRNQVAMHKGVRVWRSSMAEQLPAEGNNPTCNFSLRGSISLYCSPANSANMNCCVQEQHFQTYMLTVTLRRNGWHWPNLVTQIYQLFHILNNAVQWYIFCHMPVHLYSTSHHHCSSSVFP